ncbi:MAG: hybrid sensor histidine kinase/response regulator [Paracoccaceae bacterium]
MLREGDDPERRITKLTRINAALIERLDRFDSTRGSAWSMFQAAMALEKEVAARTRDLERVLVDLSQKNTELAAARLAAEEANRSKTRFLRAASHDLLQPLSAARLFLSTLATMEMGVDQADLVKRLGNAFESVEELMHAVLDISRLDSQRIEFNRKPVALGKLFQRLRDEFQPQAAARNLDLRFVPTSLSVDSDPTFLRRIAQNLVSNAIKYTENGKVLVGVRRQGARVWLEVHDTGIGIAADDRNRVFEEFQRLGQEGRGEPGMGLGLSIVKRACAKLDHPISLESELGRGTVFRIGLRIVGTVQQLTAQPEASRKVERDRLRGRIVLIVENNAEMRHGYELILRGSWGMETISVAGTAAAGLAMAQRGRSPDVIVADYHLGGDDTGIRTIKALRETAGEDLPAVMVTAHRNAGLARSCTRLGIRVLEKPVRPEVLQAALLRLIAERP